MSLVETVTLTIGPAIAKSLLKVWMKNGVVADAAASVLDLLRSTAIDEVSKRKAGRQLEEIGDRVAESLLPLFEAENYLEENERKAVAHALADTLNQTHIDATMIVGMSLEPDKLRDQLLVASLPFIKGLSTPAIEFFQRIVSDTSQDIIDIASNLPQFDERSIAAILRKENELVGITNQVLSEVRQMREQSQQGQLDANRFEAGYRRLVNRKLNEIQLFGADLSPVNKSHGLTVAYVSLTVEQTNSKQVSLLADSCPSDADVDGQASSIMEEVPTSVESMLSKSRRILIRGAAGSGKTTLLQWIAVRSAANNFESPLSDWNGTVPFFIRLREFSDSALPLPEDFVRSIAPITVSNMPSRWVHNNLESGRAIVLIDGLDEISEHRRVSVRDWLKDLIGTYPSCRFVVTSRPHAIEAGWMEPEGFEQAELQPMDLNSVHKFVEHWHRAVGEVLTDEEQKSNLGPLPEALKNTIQRVRAIRNLAATPLLCAMLCALHRERNRQLPQDRIDLYEACCHMLLERRDNERRIELGEYPKLSYREKQALLRDLAYYLMRNSWSMVSTIKVDNRFDQKLQNMGAKLQDVEGQEVRRLLVERSGMIRQPIADHIDFAHRTFQEFLAAQAVLAEGDIGLLTEHAHEDQWHETIILAVGLAREKEGVDIINHLLDRGDKEIRRRHQLHLLAVACLETTIELNAKVRERVERCLDALVPPKNISEAKSLASAGELVIPYLIDHKRHATTAAACVRTLAMIGGPSALAAIKNYSGGNRATVQTELIRAWDTFEPEEYARTVLMDVHRLPTGSQSYGNKVKFLPNIQHLYIDSGLGLSVHDLSTMTSLRTLSIHPNNTKEDLQWLEKMTKLKKLSLPLGTSISDLGPIQSLVQLEMLDLQKGETISSIEPLCKLGKLRYLSLYNFCNVEKTESIENLSMLENIVLNDSPICHVETLARIKTLKYLTISRDLNIEVIDHLSKLRNLRGLTLLDCRKIQDFTPLGALGNLESLSLHGCSGVPDLAPISHLKNLQALSLQGCPKISDLSPLTNLRRLDFLDLSYCTSISDLTPLRTNKGVRILLDTEHQCDIPESMQRQVSFHDFVFYRVAHPEFHLNPMRSPPWRYREFSSDTI